MKAGNGRKGKTVIYIPNSLPSPWDSFSYAEFMNCRDGKLVADGRSSRVYLFTAGGERYFLKRYQYKKIHWRFCLEKSQVRREFENLEKLRRCNLPCRVIDVLAYGERRYYRTLVDAFLLSREVPGGERLSLFLNHPDHPRRQSVLDALVGLVEEIMRQGLALTDFFFRNIIVVPEKAELYLLDVQRCDYSRRRAARKSYPQLWSNMLLFCTEDELRLARTRLSAEMSGGAMARLEKRARDFLPRERKRRREEIDFAASQPAVSA